MRQAVFCSWVVLLLVACDNGKGDDTGTVGGDDTGPGGGDDTAVEVVDADGDGSPAEEDCDDSNAAVNPSAAEVCNGIDDDCDDLIDDADSDVDLSTGITAYTDGDSDGYGDPASSTVACEVPTGAVTVGGDCNDAVAEINPDSVEVCNSIDDDCDDLIDDGDDSLDLSTAGVYYADTDGDGFGDALSSTQVCSPSSSYVADNTDCNDGNTAINPSAKEQCNGLDDDCNSSTGEDRTVSLNGAGYPDLERALAAAGTGDTVMLCNGTYVGAFTVPDGVSITSLNGAASTILEGDGSGTAAILTLDGAVSLTDLTLTNGGWSYGGAIDAFSAWGGGDIDLDGCVFDSNGGVYGGAILMYPPSTTTYTLTVVDSVFSNNIAYGTDSTGAEFGYGGAVYVVGDMDLTSTSFDGNIALVGGGLVIASGSLSVDSASAFIGNAAYASTVGGDGQGGGIYAEATDIVLDSTLVDGNYADLFGGGLMSFDAALDGGTFSNNESSVTGGGVYILSTTSLTVSDMTVSSNASTNAGGAMLHTSGTSATITLEDSTFETNYAAANGGGAWIFGDGTVSADTVIYDGNEAAEQGGGLFVEGADFLGVSVDMYDNVADEGGGSYVYSGVLYLSGGQVTGNTAYTAGGGAWVLDGELEASRGNWGTSSLDNDPDDVYIEALDKAYDSYGAAASFICDSGGC